ncbi:RNA methyltransferase, TrmH family [Austwickia chelonae]|uniref:Putative RNA methyltransferase n=1 Tax=Austwickia chelonae NBRC 105200 TaxID=1184607 RepID=K6VPJ3_9MICO|nr:RNA methyltransferase [Austwickia chelonae]GAB78649.1 putative RNA methyltransferase [Austwickia chelonae NBRC 105200]SEW34373.1 RNA methyltransferase, TrmH family [Austwickia chelonae]
MADLIITSPANPRVKSLTALRRRRVRDAQGVTLLEGVDETALALDAGARPAGLYLCPELMADPGRGEALAESVSGHGGEVVRLSRQVFEKVAYREGPDGVLAVVASPAKALADLELPADPFLLVSQGVEKPGNLGAMLRTADAAGVSAVVAADPATDWGNPNVVRGSKGTLFSVPVASASTRETLDWVAERGIALVATTPDTDLFHTDVDYTGPVAVAVGTEKTGLDDAVLAAATYKVRIPMAGRADSLNVATAAAIVLYEAVRQRRSMHTS